MTRLLTGLIMPAFLFVMWLTVNDTITPGQILLGAVLAFALTGAARALRPVRARPKRLWLVPMLFYRALVDIVRSNIDVCKIICLPPARRPASGFLQVPLSITDPHALATLACILTYTPGSVWVDLNEEKRLLTLHMLDLSDGDNVRRAIANWYEQPLKEIFE